MLGLHNIVKYLYLEFPSEAIGWLYIPFPARNKQAVCHMHVLQSGIHGEYEFYMPLSDLCRLRYSWVGKSFSPGSGWARGAEGYEQAWSHSRRVCQQCGERERERERKHTFCIQISFTRIISINKRDPQEVTQKVFVLQNDWRV